MNKTLERDLKQLVQKIEKCDHLFIKESSSLVRCLHCGLTNEYILQSDASKNYYKFFFPSFYQHSEIISDLFKHYYYHMLQS